MAAQEDSLLSPITAAADRSEATTLLVAKVSWLDWEGEGERGAGGVGDHHASWEWQIPLAI
jgi:hypothetical protein